MNLKPEHLKKYGEVTKIKEITLDLANGEKAKCLVVNIRKGFQPSMSGIKELIKLIDEHTDGVYKHLIHFTTDEGVFDYEISDRPLHI
jgi:hypothetical protein